MTKKNLQIEGFNISRFNSSTGLPIKNKLPLELQERLKTESQWLDLQMALKEDAGYFEMHSSAHPDSKVFKYYLDTEIEPLDSTIEICANCKLDFEGYCHVRGGWIKHSGRCSEWTSMDGEIR